MNEKLKATFYQRDFSLGIQPGLDFRVERLSWAAEGGAETAELYGEAAYLGMGMKFPQWALDYLRRPVEIRAESGEACWWGYVGRVEVRHGGVVSVYDLDWMANRVRVVYWQRRALVEWTGERTLTGWAENTRCVNQYGKKERVYFLPSIEESQANQARDTWLKQVGEPFSKPETKANQAADRLDTIEVKLTCRGWYSTLGWNFPQIEQGYEGFIKPAQTQFRFGRSATADAIIAQSFQTSYGPWQAGEVVVDLKQIGINADNVVMELCQNNAGVPGSTLVSVSVPASEISGGRWHVRFVLGTPVTIQANTPYWVKLSRSGALNTSNHYCVFNEVTNSYANGKHMYWTGSAWADVSTGVSDFNFYVVGQREREARILELCGAGMGGGYLAGVRLQATVTGNTLLWLEGSRNALEELEDLLRSGDANGVRMRARVTVERELVIESLPGEGTAGYTIGRDGVIRTVGGREVGVSEELAGKRALLAPGWLDESVILWRVEWTPVGGIRARVERDGGFTGSQQK